MLLRIWTKVLPVCLVMSIVKYCIRPYHSSSTHTWYELWGKDKEGNEWFLVRREIPKE